MVKFKDYCDETYTGKVVDMFSDKFDDIKWLVMGDGELSMPHYWSKKTKKYVPVREKHEASVFFEIQTSTGVEYVTAKEFL